MRCRLDPLQLFAAFALVSAKLLPTQLPGNRKKGQTPPPDLDVVEVCSLACASQTWSRESLPLGLGLHCNLHFSQPYPSSKNKAWHGQSWSSLLACIDLGFPLNVCVTIV